MLVSHGLESQRMLLSLYLNRLLERFNARNIHFS